ncbi:MAG: acetate kinase, partial [Zetaproteobacteria bacterium CG_4_8_14_3_um_filter_59_5]
NRQSGLLGLSGLSNDMRTLLQASDDGDARAALAVDIFCYRLAKSLAALAVPLGHVDALIFTGGIGEHAAAIRARTIGLLGMLGATLDEDNNRQHGKHSGGQISRSDSRLPVLVIATDEEKMIARYVNAALQEKVNPS